MLFVLCFNSLGVYLGQFSHAVVHITQDGSFDMHSHNGGHVHSHDIAHEVAPDHHEHSAHSHHHSFDFLLNIFDFSSEEKPLDDLQNLSILMLTLKAMCNEPYELPEFTKIKNSKHQFHIKPLFGINLPSPTPPPKSLQA